MNQPVPPVAPVPPPAASRAGLVLQIVLALIKPLVRLMLRHGVTYPAFAASLKPVFLAAAREELDTRAMPATDSAISLLSGVHRRDVRTLSRGGQAKSDEPAQPGGLAAEVVACWMSDPRFLDTQERPRRLRRSGAEPEPGFDELVNAISSDVRPRAVLDELIRLGVAELDPETDDIVLSALGFVPRQGFADLAAQLQGNLHDHLACACANLEDGANFLEQSIFVDELSEASALQLHRVAAQTWAKIFPIVMREARARFDQDALLVDPQQRSQRARFGVYFYNTRAGKNDD